MSLIADMRAEVASEVATISPKLRTYITYLERVVATETSDIKGHWAFYVAAAVAGVLFGHFVL